MGKLLNNQLYAFTACLFLAQAVFSMVINPATNIQSNDHPVQVKETLKTSGKQLYQQYCSHCHDSGERAPRVTSLRYLPESRIYDVITSGVMKSMAAALSEEQRHILAAYLGGNGDEAGPALGEIESCKETAKSWFDYKQGIRNTAFGLSGVNNHRAVTPDISGVTADNVKSLRINWSLPIYGATDPVIAGGAVFITSGSGDVLALDAASGCMHWRRNIGKAIRGGGAITPVDPEKPGVHPSLFVGDRAGNVIAFDAITGEQLWKVNPHGHKLASILATPVYYQGRVYVGFSSMEGDIGPAGDPTYRCCTFRGMQVALDAGTGETLWRFLTIQAPLKATWTNENGVQQYGPSGAAVLGSVTIAADRGMLLMTGDNDYSDPISQGSNAVFALRLNDGHRFWRRKTSIGNPHNAACYTGSGNCPKSYRHENRSDWGFKASPLLISTKDGRQLVVAAQKSGYLWGINPDNGELIWKRQLTFTKLNYGALHGIAYADGVVYVPVAEILKDPTKGDYAGIDELGLYAINVADGTILWKAPVQGLCGAINCKGYYNAPLVTGDLVLAASNDGYLRFYNRFSGQLVFQHKIVKTKINNNFMGMGGGPAIADGKVFIATSDRFFAYGVNQ